MPEAANKLEESAASLPTGPVVFLFKAKDGGVLYVGKAQNLRVALRQQVDALFQQFDVLVTPTVATKATQR